MAHPARKPRGETKAQLATGLSKKDQIRLLLLKREQLRYYLTQGVRKYWPQLKTLEFHHLRNADGVLYRERMLLAANQGHPLWFKILTPAGWRPIGELKPGDAVIAGDGTASRVHSVYDLGVRDIYEVSFDRGSIKVPCTDDHRWPVRSPQRNGWRIKTTLQVAARKSKQRTPSCGAVQFAPSNLWIDPYLLGVLLGDGCFCSTYLQISSADDFILEQVRALIPSTCTLVKRKGTRPTDWHISTKHNGQGRRNDLMDMLWSLGLRGKKSADKFVPTAYLLSAPEQRLALLQGLMDTDGSSRRTGASCRRQYYSSSRQLVDDVMFLVRSLGGKARVHLRGRHTYFHPKTGDERPCLQGYTVEIHLPDGIEPFRLPRKIIAPTQKRKTDTLDHLWEGTKKIGSELARCIKITHPSSLYICDGFIVTCNSGKSYSACAEVAMHLTGIYPHWWKGHRMESANMGIVACESFLLTRDGPQVLLCGAPKLELGYGLIPADCILDTTPSGIPGGFEAVRVKHAAGGISTALFRSYAQGRANLQALTVDWAYVDEEPPEDVYFELLTRTNITRGPIMMTFTPLKGVTQVVRRFWGEDKDPSTGCVHMTLDDCELYTEERKEQIIKDYPEHERDARAMGNPLAGSGLIFPVAWETIAADRFEIPRYFRQICGIDFGWDHPTGLVWLAYDGDNDVVYVTDCRKESRKLPTFHAQYIRGHGDWIPVAWPADALQTSKDTGIQLAEQYRTLGCNFLKEFATLDPGMVKDTKASATSVEAGLMLMLDRMQTGRFKVFSHLTEFKSEMQVYHRKNGKIVALNDDLISAARYACVMLRSARPQPGGKGMGHSMASDDWRL